MKRPHAQGAGPVSLGSEPDPCTPKTPETQPDTIAVLRCWEPKSKLNLRRKINSIALRANARAQRATSPDARQELRDIELLAGQWTFAAADEATLDDIRGALLRKALAADSFERNGSGL